MIRLLVALSPNGKQTLKPSSASYGQLDTIYGRQDVSLRALHEY